MRFLQWLHLQIKKGIAERDWNQDWLDFRCAVGFFGGIICIAWGLIYWIFIGGWTWLIFAFGIFLVLQLLHVSYLESSGKKEGGTKEKGRQKLSIDEVQPK